jgi:hypothetical protein
MKLRSQELKEKFLEQLNANFNVVQLNKEYIDEQAKVHDSFAFLYRIEAK